MKTRFAILVAFVSACLVAAVVACTPDAAPSPQPQAHAGGKMALDVNYVNSVGGTLAELPVVSWPFPGDNLDASASFTEISIGGITGGPLAIQLKGCRYSPSAQQPTTTAGNYATIYLYRRPGLVDGGASTLLAQVSTNTAGTGPWSAFYSVGIPVNDSGAFLQPHDDVTFVQTQADAGMALPAGQIMCFTNVQ